MNRIYDAVVFATAVISFAGCGGGVTAPDPPASSGNGQTSQTCRQYATNYRVTYTGPTTLTGTYSCAFNTGSKTLTCDASWQGAGCAAITRDTMTFPTVSGFIDEGRTLGRLHRATTTSTITSGAAGCANAGDNGTYSYDTSGRLLRTLQQGETTTFGQWDSQSRPTTGQSSIATLAYAYNDTARSITFTTTTPFGTVVSTARADADGNPLEIVNTGSLGGVAVTSRLTYTTTNTTQVCE